MRQAADLQAESGMRPVEGYRVASPNRFSGARRMRAHARMHGRDARRPTPQRHDRSALPGRVRLH
jgi:hypothetical protein